MAGAGMAIGALAVFVPLLLAAWAVVLYNRLVSLRNRVRNAYAQIDVQLTRRHGLVPNLVETARAYLRHERSALEAVTAARAAAVEAGRAAAGRPGDAEAVKAVGRAEGSLGGALARLFAIVEAYPDLKAAETMRQLSEELTTTENRIAFARQAYNDAVMFFNTARESFPGLLVARPFRFAAAALLELDDPAARAAPQVRTS